MYCTRSTGACAAAGVATSRCPAVAVSITKARTPVFIEFTSRTDLASGWMISDVALLHSAETPIRRARYCSGDSGAVKPARWWLPVPAGGARAVSYPAGSRHPRPAVHGTFRRPVREGGGQDWDLSRRPPGILQAGAPLPHRRLVPRERLG